MPIPETTSAEGLEHYVGGKRLLTSRGEAWRDIKASLFALQSAEGTVSLPSVSEPVLTWIVSGDQEIRERELDGPWITSRVKAKSFFLTTSGAPYDCNWKILSSEPVEFMLVRVELPLLQRAFEEVFGANAIHAQLQDVSGFIDAALNSLMESLLGELKRRKASPLFVQGLAQAIAIHLARNYTVLAKNSLKASSSLPGYKLRHVTAWMEEHVAEDFNLARLAAQAGISKFHFHRLFKSALGVSPSHYQINLRMNAARQMLRETKKSIIDIAMDVGYTNPSHFARLFQRETGLSPSDYRRQR
ncbi:MAG: AraC family transcriptional regulator [Verrucomicrobia bacterium Tous-C9LFEB]|nr:MAG: AraC family transcriptional regulator [Verrucomicrobia bacterium Tous-C9LFEB]